MLPRPGWLSYVNCFRRGQEEKSRCFATPHRAAFSNAPGEKHSSVRDQVVIARPDRYRHPTALRRYRRSLASKGRFAMSIGVICVGVRSGPPKRRYRVPAPAAHRSPFPSRGPQRAPARLLSRAAELLALPNQLFARRATGCLSAVQALVSPTPLAV